MAFELNTPPNWLNALTTPLEGMQLQGGYELRDLLSADDNSALFRTSSPGNPAPPALARFFRLKAADAVRQRDFWQSLTRLTHRNLLQILSAAIIEGGESSLAYVVTEGPDESLTAVLNERHLTREETDELFQSLAAALTRLHAARFVHGRVSPAEIFATGDTIKISRDCATPVGERSIARRGAPTYLAPEQQGENTTRAADVWCLGATLYQALTKTPYTPSRLKQASELPAPFGGVLARCLNPEPAARPHLAEVVSLYQGQYVPEPPPLAAAAPYEEPVVKRRAPLVLAIAALAVLLIAATIWWAKNKSESAEPARIPDAKALTTQTAPTAAPNPAPVPETPKAVTPEPPPPAAAAAAPTPERPSTSRNFWRVILWTYSKRQDAQNKVNDLTARHPELHPEVFAPDPNGKLFLVVVGGDEMTRDQARDTQRKARQLGLPRDTYVQNFAR